MTRRLAAMRPSLIDGAGLIGGGTASPSSIVISSINIPRNPERVSALGMSTFSLTEFKEPPAAAAAAVEKETAEKHRVGLIALFRYSTCNERLLMTLGSLSAAIAGLSMPVWLMLLAQSLDTFNQIGTLMGTVGAEETMNIMLDQLYKLIYSFVIVGGVTLITGCK